MQQFMCDRLSLGREDEDVKNSETLRRNPAGTQSRPAKPGQQPEASLTSPWVTLVTERRQRVNRPCD